MSIIVPKLLNKSLANMVSVFMFGRTTKIDKRENAGWKSNETRHYRKLVLKYVQNCKRLKLTSNSFDGLDCCGGGRKASFFQVSNVHHAMSFEITSRQILITINSKENHLIKPALFFVFSVECFVVENFLYKQTFEWTWKYHKSMRQWHLQFRNFFWLWHTSCWLEEKEGSKEKMCHDIRAIKFFVKIYVA